MGLFGRKTAQDAVPAPTPPPEEALPTARRVAPPEKLTGRDDAALPREERRRDYELTVILSTTLRNEEREAFLQKLRHIVADGDGELIEVGQPRQQQLAYPIRKERQGVYVTFAFRGPAALPSAIVESFRHDRALLRSLVVERQRRYETATPFSLKRPGAEQRMDEQIEAALRKTE